MKIFGDSIKTKVVAGFGLALGIIALAICLTYSSFTQLLRAVDVLSEPNSKLLKLQHTLATVSAAESAIRAYTLTAEEAHFREYLQQLKIIEGQVDTLQHLMRLNPAELAQLQAMTLLLDTKQESLQRYVALKKEQQNHRYADQAMRQIASSATRQPLATTIKQRTTTTISDRLVLKDPQAPRQQQAKAQKRGFLNKIFSRKGHRQAAQLPPPVLVPELSVSQEVKTDTSTTAAPAAPLAKVHSILHKVQRQADQQEQQLRARELALLQQDKQIMDRIRHMMHQLEQYEQQQSAANAAKARAVARKTSLILLLVGLGGLGSGIAFSLLILRDITRSNTYKSKLVQAQQEAVQLARAKEAFVATMSHEMRTPLNVVLGFTQQLFHTPLQPQQQQHLQAIQGAGRHLLHIVNDVLDLSKIEAGKLQFHPVAFNLRQLLAETERAFALKASDKHIHFSCHADTALPDTLVGDALRLKQILLNLTDNALKFTHQGRVQVSVKLRKQRRSRLVVGIEVSDTGIGIPQERLEHIFGEFNQADDSVVRHYGGTGLGLAISKKLVDMQGGTLTVASTPGQGTTFSVVLPLQATSMPVPTTPLRAVTPTAAFAGITALVIEDDAYSRSLCELILRRWGIKVYLANDGHQALALIQQRTFDVVLTDMQLPGMSGKAVARRIRQQDEKVPIIALTANIMSSEAGFFAGTAISGHLLKPFTEQELFQQLTAALPHLPQAQAADDVIAAEAQPQTALYDLEPMRLFTGPDKQALAAVLEVLLADQEQNLAQLAAAAHTGDWEATANTAHKMLTAFKHLQAHTVTPHLQQLEHLLHTGSPESINLKETVEQARRHAREVLQALARETAALRTAYSRPAAIQA